MFDAVRLRLNHMERWKNSTIKIMGAVEFTLGVMLLIPTIVALIYGEDASYFFILVPPLMIAGSLQYLLFSKDNKMSPSVSILMMTVAWFIAFFVIAVPFYIYGFAWYDAIFESVSGFTTTGFSIVPNVEELPKSMLFWRSFSQWVGGVSVVLVFMFILPMMGIGGRAFINNEFTGTDMENYSVRMRSVAMSFIYIYILFSLMEVILLMAAGVNLFESTCMMMSCLSTGGFMVKADSLASYSFTVQLIVVIFMFLGGTNFYLHYRTLYRRDYKAYVRSQEFVWTFLWFVIAIFLVLLAIIIDEGKISGNVDDNFWYATFTVVSFGTATGYTIYDYSVWPAAASCLLLFVGFIGAMSGSTTGGVKVYRMIILKSYISYGFYKMLHPHAIRDVKLDGRTVDSDALMSAIVITVSFLIVAAVGTTLIALAEPDIDMMECLGLCIPSLGNVGAGLGQFGPAGSLVNLSVFTKLVMAAVMWIGRLEVFMVLILFTRAFWGDIILNTNSNKHSENRRQFFDSAYRRKRQ
ncbi:MAG: TrkH family potassium uptake protein [Candidatus Methanogranum gryphiswaldense]|nr:MAG: TrkH family potassium uptake protein [Candidatus Methanogranum sp. U3.2.1]